MADQVISRQSQLNIGNIMQRDIKSLDLNLLKVLHALIEERSVTKAASRVGLTQPAVSGILLRLRESFGDPLLVRAHRGMVPTSRALELGPAVRRVLADIEGMLQPSLFDPGSAEFTLTLAASDYALSVVLQPFFAALRQKAPGVRTVVHQLSRSLVASQLEAGTVDIALMAAASEPELHVTDLFEERFVCAMRDGHPAAQRSMSLDLFCSLDQALVAFDGGFDGLTDKALAAVGRKRRVVLSVANFLVLPTIIHSTDVIAVAPVRLVADLPGICLRDPPVDLPGFALSAAWHERSHHDPALSWARSLLVDACAPFRHDGPKADKLVGEDRSL